MAALPAGCARLVFADPPFGIGYSYDVYNDHMSSADYLKWAGRWVSEAARLVAPDGSLWLAIGDEYAAHYKLMLDATGFTMRNWIIWHYTFGVHAETKFSRCHAHILYYVRNASQYVWNKDAVAIESDRSGKYGDARGVAIGKTPPDVWEYPRICGTFGERVKKAAGEAAHPCQMNSQILDRIIRVASDPGDLVIDPFGGSGTTAATAKRLRRRYWTSELSPAYADVIRARLDTVDAFGDGDDMAQLANDLGIT